MVKRKTKTNFNLDTSGILQTILSMFSFGQINICTDKDNSYYCKIMKLFNLLIVLIVILVILYFLYKFVFNFNKIKYGGKCGCSLKK